MTKPKAPGKGHNSKKADAPVDVSKEILAAAERLKTIDEKFIAAKAKHKEDAGEVSADLKKLGIKKKNFTRAYDEWLAKELAENPKDRRAISDEWIIDHSQYLQAYKALNKGKTLNFLDVHREAKGAVERVEKAEGEGAAQEIEA